MQQQQEKPQPSYGSYETYKSANATQEQHAEENFTLNNLVFKNKEHLVIPLKDITQNFTTIVQLGEILYELNGKVENDSLVFYIVQGPAGEPCKCCNGSGKKEMTHF